MITVGCLCSDHVQMSLDDNRITVLVSGSTRFFDDYVVHFILDIFQIVSFCKFHTKITDFFCVEGTSGYHT